MGGVVDVTIWLNDYDFKTKARVVTTGMNGVGLRVIEESALASRDWKSFYDIIKSRGYINRFV